MWLLLEPQPGDDKSISDTSIGTSATLRQIFAVTASAGASVIHQDEDVEEPVRTDKRISWAAYVETTGWLG